VVGLKVEVAHHFTVEGRDAPRRNGAADTSVSCGMLSNGSPPPTGSPPGGNLWLSRRSSGSTTHRAKWWLSRISGSIECPFRAATAMRMGSSEHWCAVRTRIPDRSSSYAAVMRKTPRGK
jgi:hypothetical protein